MPRKHKPVHPGEILQEEFLKPLGISKYRLAKETGMPADRVGKITQSARAVTGDTALRLARFFGTTPEFWMNLQARFELEAASDKSGREIERRITPWRAA
jgi:addiction module HigA family antidote